MNKIVLIYGLIGGLIISVLMWLTLGSERVDFENGELIGYTTMVVALSTIFFGVKAYRDKHLDGRITFGKAFLLGLYIALVASTLYVASWMLLSATTGDYFMVQYYEHAKQEMESSNMPAEEMNAKLEEMQQFAELYKNPIVKIGFTYLEILPVSLLVSLLVAAILKRKEARS